VLATRAARAAVTAAVALASLLALSPGAAAAPSYTVPSGAWARFQSDLNGAEGLATGRGVTIALLSTGADTSGFRGRVSNGPNYIFKPEIALTHAIGTLTAGLILGVPGAVRGVAPDARILALRTSRISTSRAPRPSSPGRVPSTSRGSTPRRSGTRSATARR